MRLRQLFESKQSVGFIFGRFNPPHKGHRAAWEMLSQNDAWYVGTNTSTQGPKDPLPYNIKIKAMEAIWPEVTKHITPSQSWLTLASEIYKKHGDVELKIYTDEEWVIKTINQYNGKEGPHGLYNFSKITPVATPRLSSATALRTAVAAGDKKAFADAAGVPADTPVDGVPFFDLVAEYLGQYKKESVEPDEHPEIHSENVLDNKKKSSSYMLQLERDKRANMLVLHILDKDTGKRTEVRGKIGYETNGYDPEDKLHQLLDKVGKSASVSDLMNGDVVSINPRHPDGASAKAATDRAYNEAFDTDVEWVSDLNSRNVQVFATKIDDAYIELTYKRVFPADVYISFTRGGRMSVTGEGSQNKIFGAVINHVKQWVAKNKPPRIIFSAFKPNTGPFGSQDTTRSGLYSKMIQRFAGQNGYEYDVEDTGNEDTFILTKKNVEENFADSKVKYAKPQFDVEWEEAERYPEFVKIGKAAWIELANKGKAVTIKSAKGINNTDAADADSFKSLDKDKQARALAQLKSGNVEMPIVAVYPDGWKELIGGNTRLTAMLAQDGKATVWVFKVPNEVAELAENFADGKKPGRKGLAKRSGVNTKASVSSLRKTAKNSSGEKQRMAHWLANMKAGKQRASETIVEFDEEDEIYYSKKLAPVAKKLFQTMYPEAKVKTVEDGDGYLSIETTDGVFGFSIGVTHQYGDNVISVGNAYAGSYKGVVGQLVKAAAELLQKKHPDGETTLVAQHDVSDNYWPQLANKLGINYENNAW